MDNNRISWGHLVDFYEQDSSKILRMAPRLTKKHIDLPPFAPLNVSLAAQVLSHSVATGMSLMAQLNIIPGNVIGIFHATGFINTNISFANEFNTILKIFHFLSLTIQF